MNTKSPTTSAEKAALTQLAIGRLLALGSRPTQDGDAEQYEQIRAIVLACAEET